jgi:hypothetical protein
MKTQVNRMQPAAPAWLYLQRAREAVNKAAAELPRTQFDPQARRQYALELAALMGKVELLLNTLQRQASDDPVCAVAQPPSLGDRHHANHRNQATVAHLDGRYF